MRNELDSTDLLILETLYKQPNVSVRELCNIALIRAPSAMMYRLRKMEELELLAPPPKTGLHRSRHITKKGITLLEEQRIIPKCKQN